MKSVGELIKEYREKKGLSQRELANKIGFKEIHSGQIISNIERGESPLPKKLIAYVCHAVGIPADLMFEVWMKEQEKKFWDAYG